MARFSWTDACRLDPTLASLTHFSGCEPKFAESLLGGLTNRCWLIHAHDQTRYVWRPHSPVSEAFAISRYQEAQILRAIQPSGLAPQVIAVNDHGLLVEWIKGETQWYHLTYHNLIELLALIHQLNVTSYPLSQFDYTARVDHYWQQLPLALRTPQREAQYQRWRLVPELQPLAVALCHCDLGGYNIILSDTGFRVIDWEYAALADPRFDLALTIQNSGASAVECVEYYCQLRQIEAVSEWLCAVEAWQPRTQMMAMLWYLLAFHLWGNEDYLQQAATLEQALTAIRPDN